MFDLLNSKSKRSEFELSMQALIALQTIGAKDETLFPRWKEAAVSDKEPVVICIHVPLQEVRLMPLQKFLELNNASEDRESEEWSKGTVRILFERLLFPTSFENVSFVLSTLPLAAADL